MNNFTYKQVNKNWFDAARNLTPFKTKLVLVDEDTGEPVDYWSLRVNHQHLNAVGYHVQKAKSIGFPISKKMPDIGTVTDIDENFVYIEGPDLESYNISRYEFSYVYEPVWTEVA